MPCYNYSKIDRVVPVPVSVLPSGDDCYMMWSFGGGWYVGKALSLALAKKGIFVTVVDFSEENGRQVASLAEKESAKFHSNLEFPSAIFVKCDVSNMSKWKIFVSAIWSHFFRASVYTHTPAC